MNLFLCGDVMTGRGIDQILARPSEPTVYEPVQDSALGYVELAEARHGPISRPVDSAYIWGDALAKLQARSPDVRHINLETSVTTSPQALAKGINYRMHPGNIPCLLAAAVDIGVLANNHVLDWGTSGLLETLTTLRDAGIATVGAGRDGDEARQPAITEFAGGPRLLVFAFGSPTSGIPTSWEATDEQPGVRLVYSLSESAHSIAEEISGLRRPGDVVVASIHWGGNWGYEVPAAQRVFAHRLIDSGCVDVVHGHSSYHAKGIEVYEGRPILYGCGDFINDYEGIGGFEVFRPELALAYFVSFDTDSSRLKRLEMVPFQSLRFRLQRAGAEEAERLCETLNREGRELGTSVELSAGGVLALRWRSSWQR